MQITLNTFEVAQAIREHIESIVTIPDGFNVEITAYESGDFQVDIIDPSITEVTLNRTSGPVAEKPAKKPRRTKAQIAEDERLAAEQAEAAKEAAAPSPEQANSDTQTTSAEAAKPSEPVQVEDAGDTNPNPETSLGTEPEPEVDPTPEPEPEVVQEAEASAAEPDAAVETPKPTVSLFANLRKVQN